MAIMTNSELFLKLFIGISMTQTKQAMLTSTIESNRLKAAEYITDSYHLELTAALTLSKVHLKSLSCESLKCFDIALIGSDIKI